MKDICISKFNQSGKPEIPIKLEVLYITFCNMALQCSSKMKADLITTIQYINTPVASIQCSVRRNRAIHRQGQQTH
jgi:hypothetical protein